MTIFPRRRGVITAHLGRFVGAPRGDRDRPPVCALHQYHLAEYLVPVNADVDQVEVILVPETDTLINPLGIKGLGELGNVGTNAAIANAVYHATGVRVRDLPIRLENLLDVTT